MSWADPVAAFRDIAAGHERMFWLDGGGSRDWSGRRSILGWLEDDDVSLTYDAARREVWEVRDGDRRLVGDDIFTVLAEEVARDGGDPEVSWVGWFGYACRPDLPALTGGGVPDAVWMRSQRRLVFDHEPPPTGRGGERAPAPTAAGSTAVSRSSYDGWFARVQEQLRLGNTYEVNLTYRESVPSKVAPADAYLRLREVNPAPYAAYLQHEGVSVLSSSPERFATIDRRRWVETKPIKGTTPRGATAREDEAHREALRSDPRYRAENLMIVDLLRNDLSMVCEPGTVTVPVLMEVESYSNVHQLVSTVRGHLRDGVGTVEALRALFPAGSMTGAPKLRTMEVIADVETTPRGVYSGALGWIGGDGRADLGVVIRTLVAHDGVYTLGTGGGITVRSDAASEYDETRWKAARLLEALR
ncbi:MAG TPA: anthranilate synthase component I family protein [Nocardioidaceae bacterium]|nr:anthranilate synthase component I family protein [Nocardioidaceae bacterium]